MENNNSISIGNLVKLKSGSPLMTVIDTTKTMAICTWYNYIDNRFEKNSFLFETIEKHNKNANGT